MEGLEEILKYWHILLAIIAVLYFIFKLSLRNAILEVFNELEEKFIKKDLFEARVNAIEDRINKLERTRENQGVAP